MRRLRLILICVLLGAVTTVGVAWGLVFRDDAPPSPYADAVLWPPGAERIVVHVDRFPDELHDLAVREAAPRRLTDFRYQHHRRGWPMLALGHREWWAWEEPPGFMSGEFWDLHRIDWAIPIHDDPEIIEFGRLADGVCLLPRMPLPLGFAVDTIVFGQVWCVLITLPGWIKRIIRRRRGCCIVCGYRIAHRRDARCPECGVTDPAAPDPWPFRRLARYVAAGLATSIVVAWALAFVPLPKPLIHYNADDFVTWPVCRRELRLNSELDVPYDAEIHDQRGWPMPAMESIQQCDIGFAGFDSVGFRWGMMLSPPPGDGLLWEPGIVVPMRPCIAGIVIDSLVFMQIWIAGTWAVRRIRRTP